MVNDVLISYNKITIKIFLGQSGVSIKVHRIALRMLLIVWIFYGTVFTTTFQTRLISIISSPRTAKQILALADVIEQEKFSVHLQEMYYRIHFTEQNPEDQKFLKILKDNQTLDALQTQVKNKNFIAQLSYFSFCYYYNYTLEPETQRPLLTYLKDGQFLYTLNLLIPKRHPLFEMINDAIAHIHQYGHFQKIYMDVVDAAYKPLTAKPDHAPLNILQLYLPFGALIIGLVLSFIVFVYERCKTFIKHNMIVY